MILAVVNSIVPLDEVWFQRGDVVVGKITNIGFEWGTAVSGLAMHEFVAARGLAALPDLPEGMKWGCDFARDMYRVVYADPARERAELFARVIITETPIAAMLGLE